MLLGYDSTHRTRQGHYQPDGPNFHPPDIHAGLASPPSSLPSSSASSSAVSEGLSAVRGVVLRFPGNIQLRTVLGAHLTFLGWVLGPGGACFSLQLSLTYREVSAMWAACCRSQGQGASTRKLAFPKPAHQQSQLLLIA